MAAGEVSAQALWRQQVNINWPQLRLAASGTTGALAAVRTAMGTRLRRFRLSAAGRHSRQATAHARAVAQVTLHVRAANGVIDLSATSNSKLTARFVRQREVPSAGKTRTSGSGIATGPVKSECRCWDLAGPAYSPLQAGAEPSEWNEKSTSLIL